MTDTEFNPGVDAHGVPARYSAEWHYAGCLPDTDVLYWDTPREAWNDLIERLDQSDIMWEPDDPEDWMGPSHRTEFALTLERMAREDRPGQVTDREGMIYSVEDTHTMRCGHESCGMTFPDIYPAGRCPYEDTHELFDMLHTAMIEVLGYAAVMFSREDGAR